MPITEPALPHLGAVELRQYTLRPGRREELIDLFDRHFVETQEEVGIRVIGQFRDLDDPDRFVWLRGFPDMATRAESLSAFYERHPVWKEHRDAANATMVDSDNVLLLGPATTESGFPSPVRTRPPVGAASTPASLIAVTIHHLDSPGELQEFADFFERRMRPLLTEVGAPPLASLQTEYAENTFPKLPVRTGENVFVHVTAFPGPDRHREHPDGLASRADWRREVVPELTERLVRRPELLRLTPTSRSALR
ncbi:MAG: NIPSNAP family protein [Oryzihumus sp.]